MKKMIILLAVMALALLAGCGQDGAPQAPDPDPAPVVDDAPEPEAPPSPGPAPAEPEKEPEDETPEDPTPVEQPDEEENKEEGPAPDTVEVPPEEPAPDPAEPEEQPVSAQPDPEPGPEPEPAPEETIPEDGTYTASVTLEGGSGRAKVSSPATLRCEDGQFYATITWSSPNFDYMKVDGEKYELVSEPGSNSTFEIPVAAFDQKLDVIADTVAMSEPHEVEYTLTFDSASLQKQ